MVLYTLIVRLSDGMPLMASTDATPEIYKNQAKAITKKLHLKSPSRMSVESGPVSFNYIIEEGIVFLTMSDASYPRKLAFAFLADVYKHFVEELQHEFGDNWRMQVSTTARPYAFLRFDRVVQRIKREYADPSSKQNSSRLSEGLADIQNIMRQNLEEVLNRGEKLENVSKISSRLVSESKRFRWSAKRLNILDAWKKYAPWLLALLLILAVVYWRFFY